MSFLGFGKKEEKKVSLDVARDDSVESESTVEETRAIKSAPKEKTGSTPTLSKKKKEVARPTSVGKVSTSVSDYSGVLIKPRITEKATILAEENNVYTFNVDPRASKKEISKAVQKNYEVNPVKVNISDVKRKRVFARGKKGIKAGGKKAMVYLKKGDKIEFV